MVMRPDCVVAAMDAAEQKLSARGRPKRILLTPQGRRFELSRARALSVLSSFLLVCGRYEGFDERVRFFAVDVIQKRHPTSVSRTEAPAAPPRSGLAREMGLLGLVATGVCSMIGAGINVIPFMIQRHAPGIGPHVLPAFRA